MFARLRLDTLEKKQCVRHDGHPGALISSIFFDFCSLRLWSAKCILLSRANLGPHVHSEL